MPGTPQDLCVNWRRRRRYQAQVEMTGDRVPEFFGKQI